MEQVKAYFATLKDPRNLGLIALCLAIGAAGSGIYYKVALEPQRAIADKQFLAHNTLVKLYDLQMAHHQKNGTFANDLETLLGGVPGAADIRARLTASVDINTLAVIGDANRFRLEANVLDPARTSIKIRGPVGER